MLDFHFTSSGQWVVFAGSCVVPVLVHKGVLPLRECVRQRGWIKGGALGTDEKTHTRQFHTRFDAISAIPAVFSLFFIFRRIGDLVNYWHMQSLRIKCLYTFAALGIFTLVALSLMLASSYLCGWIDRERRGQGGNYCLPNIWADFVSREQSAGAFLALLCFFALFWVSYSAWAAVEAVIK